MKIQVFLDVTLCQLLSGSMSKGKSAIVLSKKQSKPTLRGVLGAAGEGAMIHCSTIKKNSIFC